MSWLISYSGLIFNMVFLGLFFFLFFSGQAAANDGDHNSRAADGIFGWIEIDLFIVTFIAACRFCSGLIKQAAELTLKTKHHYSFSLLNCITAPQCEFGWRSILGSDDEESIWGPTHTSLDLTNVIIFRNKDTECWRRSQSEADLCWDGFDINLFNPGRRWRFTKSFSFLTSSLSDISPDSCVQS